MKNHIVSRSALLALTLLVAAPAASASTAILDEYTRTGQTDTLYVPFTSWSVLTPGSYMGPVEVLVSGTGYSLWNIINDSFHGVAGQTPLDSQYYQLNVGWDSAPLVPFSGEPRNITNFISFVEGVGAVTPAYTPAYAGDNTYHFVIDTGLLATSQLQFGVSDGNFGDNGGAYNLQVWQLEKKSASVPDTPAPYALASLAALLAASGRLRRLAKV